jgi:hypothetical protein
VNMLPDSRLQDRNLETVMADWPLVGGGTVRIEVSPVFCANCGKKYGFVPKENTAFTCWLCRDCYETYGAIAGTFAMPDDDFNQSVQAEMEERFGHALTLAELAYVIDRGQLGTALEKLEKESPYPVPA